MFMYTVIEYALARPEVYKEATGEWPEDLIKCDLKIERTEPVKEIKADITVEA